MTLYIIRRGKVTAQRSAPARTPKHALIVRSAAEIETSDLTAARLVALWNGMPGASPLTKFKDRKTAARRLWGAFEQLSPRPASNSRQTVRAPASSKQAQVIAMLHRAAGATIEEIVDATGWQRHSVRGLISGALKKKLGLDVASAKEERGRVYRIDQRAA